MNKQITIYTDGAAQGNPGRGGYGVVLLSPPYRKELSEGFRLTTNNWTPSRRAGSSAGRKKDSRRRRIPICGSVFSRSTDATTSASCGSRDTTAIRKTNVVTGWPSQRPISPLCPTTPATSPSKPPARPDPRCASGPLSPATPSRQIACPQAPSLPPTSVPTPHTQPRASSPRPIRSPHRVPATVLAPLPSPFSEREQHISPTRPLHHGFHRTRLHSPLRHQNGPPRKRDSPKSHPLSERTTTPWCTP